MFCPKCGIKNPESGKFCRSCGTDLSPVSEALAGRSGNKMQNFGGMFEPIQPLQPMSLSGRKGKAISWESMLSTVFTGLAFLIISIILGVTNMAGGQHWWFWLLIPGFAMLGTGLAQYIQLRKSERLSVPPFEQTKAAESLNNPSGANLPPIQTDYIAPDSRYKTGDLVPPSVIENTTRHLEINSEGETMTLPKK